MNDAQTGAGPANTPKLKGFRLALYTAYTKRGLRQCDVAVRLFCEPHDAGIPRDRLFLKYQPRVAEFLSGAQKIARNIHERMVREFPELEGMSPEEGFYGEVRQGHGAKGGNPDAAGGKEIPKTVRAPAVGARRPASSKVTPAKEQDDRAIVIVDGKGYLEGDEPKAEPTRDELIVISKRWLDDCLAEQNIRVGSAFATAAGLASHLETGGTVGSFLTALRGVLA